jgi:hypothetical protein
MWTPEEVLVKQEAVEACSGQRPLTSNGFYIVRLSPKRIFQLRQRLSTIRRFGILRLPSLRNSAQYF